MLDQNSHDRKHPAIQDASAQMQAESIVRSLSTPEKIDLLLEVVGTDERWRDIVLRRFGPLDDAQAKTDFVAGIYDIVRANSYRGFIDYRSAFHCEQELYAYVSDFLDPYMERGVCGVVLHLTFALMLSLQKIVIDDSDGFFSAMIGLGNHYWEELLATGDEAIGASLFCWIPDLVRTEDNPEDMAGIFWYLQENAREVLGRHFATDARFAAETEALAQSMLESVTNEEDLGFSCTFLTCAPWAIVKLRCMQTLKRPLDEMIAFAESQPPLYDITSILVDTASEAGDDDVAVLLLEALIDRSRERSYPTEAALRLLDLLKERSQQEKVTLLYLDLIAHGRAEGENQLRSWIRKARENAGDQWPLHEEKLAAHLEADRYRLMPFYAETEQLDKLMKVISQRGSLCDLRRYDELLAEKYPNEYLSRYETIVRQMLFGAAAGRKAYRKGVDVLFSMREIPGGLDIADKVVSELHAIYPRRRALMEELDILG